MIRLVAKSGLIIEFKMKNDTIEREIVSKFYYIGVDKEQVLKLGRYGKIKVKDIYAMSVIETPAQTYNTDISSLFEWANK